MIAAAEVPEPFPVFPLLIAVLVCTIGVATLLSAFLPALRMAIRVPMPMMNNRIGRTCISLWCFALAAIELARAFQWLAVRSHENWLYVGGFGSLALGFAYGFLSSKQD